MHLMLHSVCVFITNQFAEGEMNVARYNVKRKAYVAAVQRARWVVEYYQETPQVPEALATLVYSYQQLGMNDLANQYLDLLKTNYPKLVHGDTVNLAEARGEASWVNKMTLGILGKPATTIVPNGPADQPVKTPIPSSDVNTPAQPTTLQKTGQCSVKLDVA